MGRNSTASGFGIETAANRRNGQRHRRRNEHALGSFAHNATQSRNESTRIVDWKTLINAYRGSVTYDPHHTRMCVGNVLSSPNGASLPGKQPAAGWELTAKISPTI